MAIVGVSDQLYDVSLRLAVALDIALGCRERGVAREFLNVAEGTAGLYDLLRHIGNERSAPGMRRCSLDPQLGEPGVEPNPAGSL